MNTTRRDFLRLSAAAALQAAVFSAGMPRAAAAASIDKDRIAYLPAVEQIELFKSGKLSPVEVLEAQIERILQYNGPLNTSGDEPQDFMQFNGKVNAVTCEFFDEARKAAKEAEKRYKDGTARPLEGITVAVKDENEVKGWRVTMGSRALKDAPVCEENSAIIERLLEAGAILHIQTTVPELYLHIQTWSRLWGVTRNPWNEHYAVGGSSGGSGAALAAGFSTLATGSDMGGSIRIPASLCGVYGFKPPFGRVSTSEVSFETLGPMARTFGDMVLMQNILVGPHPTVHSSLRPRLDYPQTYDSLKGVKIAVDFFEDWVPGGIDASVRKSLEDAANVLRGRGAVVEEVKLGWKCADIFATYADGLLSTGMGEMVVAAREFKDIATTYVAHFVETMDAKGPVEMARSDAMTTALHRQLQAAVFSKGYEALLMPTLATPYLTAEDDPAGDTMDINGYAAKSTEIAMTYPWNMMSRYPVVTVPVGLGGNSIPMGMQVVGNTYDDLAAFRVAAGYAQAGLHLYQDSLLPDFRNKK